MKKLLTLLFATLIASTAFAQAEKSIIIDQNSFRDIHTDALTGVNIDPIGLDDSKRPCARLKVKINRMTREEINAIEVKIITNNQLTKNKTSEYDNGLIIEMTAKPQTRFYFHHDEFGDSNEVCLDLEAGKEYYLEAYLNQSFSIVVNTNVVGADIYIDNLFKGQTDSNMSCTISDVMIGNHNLKIVYGNVSREQSIDVNKNSILFRQTINIEKSKPQFVVFVVEPQNAVVTIENNHYPLQDGAMQTVLNNGSYNYTVSAVGYHPQSGVFTVSGAKVEKVINLTADSAKVTLTAPDNAEIWVNNEKKGVSTWSGTLTSSTYIFEARKEGHRTATLSAQITSNPAQQSYTLPAPEPIVGTVVVTSTPIMADVQLDGKPVGRTPLELNNILVGKHTLTLSKEGYETKKQTLSLIENKTETINITLAKTSSATRVQTVQRGSITSAPYKVGDYYNDGKKEGVVFEVSADGRSGKIVSLEESTNELKWFSGNYYESQGFTGADSEIDGMYNMSKIKTIPGWQNKFPAFKWCAGLGEGWYLPSVEEIKKIVFCDDNIFNKIANTIVYQGGKPFASKWYWSSTEQENTYNTVRCINTSNNHMDSSQIRTVAYRVRAVTTFGDNITSYIAQSNKVITSAPYKVGDYYNDGSKRGIVFEISADGKHGKIVSLVQSASIYEWAEKNANRLIGADNKIDGKCNMDKVKSIKDWQIKYPAFRWCANLGEGWYLPAIEELKKFTIDTSICNAINHTLTAMGYLELPNRGLYWSSTESGQKYKGTYSILSISKGVNKLNNVEKDYMSGTVRAVAKF